MTKTNQNLVTTTLALSLLLFVSLGCRAIADRVEQNAEKTNTVRDQKTLNVSSRFNLFPVDQACNYPSTSSVQRFRNLGGGRWRHYPIEGIEQEYDCGIAEKSLEFPFEREKGEITVEYGVLGYKNGAESVGLDYSVFAESSIPSEPEFRTDFVRLVEETVQKALKGSLPETAKAQMLDLKSYPNSGVRNQEEFIIGEGKILINRNRNSASTSIVIKAQVCADKSSECL